MLLGGGWLGGGHCFAEQNLATPSHHLDVAWPHPPSRDT